ncbi:hypothetical protein HZA96_05830 [Candidatus Woesearchaeota archaeon]|nr:hypothetical protein [Candidatus Woesearchaeota archaeon]
MEIQDIRSFTDNFRRINPNKALTPYSHMGDQNPDSIEINLPIDRETIDKGTIGINTAEGGLEYLKISEILKIAFFELQIAASGRLEEFKTQIPYVLKVINTRQGELNHNDRVYLFDYQKKVYRDIPAYALAHPESTIRRYRDLGKMNPQFISANLNEMISKLIEKELQSDPSCYFFLHKLGDSLQLNAAYLLLPFNQEYISLESQVNDSNSDPNNNSNIPYFQRRNLSAAISVESELLKNKRGSYRGFFGAEGKSISNSSHITNVGKALYYIFHNGKEIAAKDLEGTVRIALQLKEPFIHQFGATVDFNLLDNLQLKLKQDETYNGTTYEEQE